MFQVILFADGSCRRNGTELAQGSFKTVLKYGQHEKELTGSADGVTSNQMELKAVVEGIRALKKPCQVAVYSDSTYVINGARSIDEWRDRDWKRKDKKPIANVDLWQELSKLIAEGNHRVNFHHRQGASARQERRGMQAKAQGGINVRS